MNATKTNDPRSGCQFCGVKTWNRDYVGFMRDHDRPDGRRCQRAAVVYSGTTRRPHWAK